MISLKNSKRFCNYPKLLIVIILLISSKVYADTYYIDYAAGSDTNNGLSKAAPWKHAPGMNGASGKVLAYETAHPNSQGTAPAGDSFIFKGGVTWPNDCFVWAWIWGGGTGWTVGVDAVYFGVDKTWYSGGSWSRPIFDAQGLPVTTFTRSNPPITNVMFRPYKGTGGYFIIDNLEFIGMYQFYNYEFAMLSVAATIAEVKNCYFHGWGHGPVTNIGPCDDYYDGIMHSYCNKWDDGPDSGELVEGALRAITGPGGRDAEDIRVHHCYIDGSDSYPTPGDMAAATKGFMNHFYNNYVAYVQNIITSNFCDYVWGNTFIELSRIPDFNSSNHHNLYQSYGGEGRNSYVYNNYAKGIAGGATFLWYPRNTTKFYAFNNVMCEDKNQIFQLSSGNITSESNTAGFYIWNNTVQCVNENPVSAINGSKSGYAVSVFSIKNNHLIAPNPVINACVNSAVLDSAANILQNNAEAIALGYTSESTYPLFPPSESSLTVGTGTDISSIFNELIDSDPSYPSVACLYDATLGVSINETDHTVSYPNRTPVKRGSAWDIGAYEYIPSTAQSLSLTAGWNWISFNVLPGDLSLNSVFNGILPQVEQVKTQTQSKIRSNGNWKGDLANMNGIGQYKMYKVKVNAARTLTVTGSAIVQTTPINLAGGWNWVAFLPTTTMPIATALDSIKSKVQEIKSLTQSATYSGGAWSGTLTQLDPGQGYAIKMSGPGTLTYPAGQ
jgi:hypothetical protein